MLPTAPITFGQIFSKSIQQFFNIFKKIVPFIVIMVIAKDWSLYIGRMPTDKVGLYITEVILAIVIGYMVVASFYATNAVIQEKKLSIFAALVKSLLPTLNTIIVCILYSAIFTVLLYFGHFLGSLFQAHKKPELLAIINFFIVGLPFFILIILSFFTIPLIAAERLSIISAFKESVKLAWGKTWLRIVVLYIILVFMMYLIDSNTRHGQFFHRYYMNAVFDFIVLSIVLPIYYGMIIYTIHDLRLWKQGNKQESS